MRDRIARALGNEAGNVMISNIIGSMVMVVVAGAIATGIGGLLLFQGAINDKTALTKEISLVDSVLRSDILWASVITATDEHTVEMTVPGRDGRCKVNTWEIGVRGGKTVLDSTVVSYPGIDASVNPVRCSGAASSPTTQTLIADAAASSAFTYANPAGRQITYTTGTPVLGGAAAPPAGVDGRSWASLKLSAVTLDTEISASTPRRAAYRITQTADNLSVIQDAADAPSHFVPEGNLTALPAG